MTDPNPYQSPRQSGEEIAEPVRVFRGFRRLYVVGPGLVFGAVLGFVLVNDMPSGATTGDWAIMWAAFMSGPIVGTAWGMAEYHPQVAGGWLGLLFAAAHPIFPHWATGLLTAVGLFLWYVAGFATVYLAVWA